MATIYVVLISIGTLVAGLVIGGFVVRWLIMREMKKNPPINEKMIEAMYTSMGRKPSKAQVRRTMDAMKNAK